MACCPHRILCCVTNAGSPELSPFNTWLGSCLYGQKSDQQFMSRRLRSWLSLAAHCLQTPGRFMKALLRMLLFVD